MTTESNHGHVFPREDGGKAKCGGPNGPCKQCQRDAERKAHGATEFGTIPVVHEDVPLVQDPVTVEVSQAEVTWIISALYSKLIETKDYLRTSKSIIESHKDHGEECCAKARVEREKPLLADLEQRKASIKSAIAKFEAVEP